MILGMRLATFTLVHLVISLIAIASGLVVVFGMIASLRLPRLTGFFLVMTALTSLTGFLFPFKGMTPAILFGMLSMMALGVAAIARHGAHLHGAWRGTWVVSVALAVYLNFFVLVVQLFEKVPALRALAPTQKELPFKVTHLVALLLFVALTFLAMRRFRAGILGSA